MDEWLRHQLQVVGALAGLLGGSRLFQYLTAAAPGVTELVTIGKVWDLAQLERRSRRHASVRHRDRGRAGHRPRRWRCCAPRAPTPTMARVGPIASRRSRSTTSCAIRAAPASWRWRCQRRCRSTRRSTSRSACAPTWAWRSSGRGQRACCPDRFDAKRGGAARRRRRARASQAARAASAAPWPSTPRGGRSASSSSACARGARAGGHACRSCSSPSSAARAGAAVATGWRRSCDRGLARAQGGLHLRGIGRRGQDHHLGGDRARHGGPREARSPCSRSTRRAGWPTRSACPSWATRSGASRSTCTASCGR